MLGRAAHVLLVLVLGTLVGRVYPQEAQTWMFGVEANDQRIYLYNPAFNTPRVELDPWAAGSYNPLTDTMDGIAMDAANNQLILPRCTCDSESTVGCTKCDMWSYDVVTGTVNKFLDNWPPMYQWVTQEPSPTVVAGTWANGGFLTIQPWQNAGVAANDEAFIWWLPMTFNAATRTYTAGAPKRYKLKVSGCANLYQNNAADLAYSSITKKAYWSGNSAGCPFFWWDATNIATAANNTVFTGTVLPDGSVGFLGFDSTDTVLYLSDCGGFYTVDQTTATATFVPGYTVTPCYDMTGSSVKCPLGAPIDLLPPGTCPSPGPSPGPGGCAKVKHAYASTSPSGKVAPYKTFGYSATLANSPNAATGRQLFGSVDAQTTSKTGYPFLNATFTMPIPMGVVLRSSGSSPKLATTPVVDTAAGTVTWPLGNLRAGKKVKVAFKLVASNCTTPAELSLNGKFTYTDATGAKTVDACLKRPLYIWEKGCPAIPKPGHTDLGHNKPINQCCCSACDCDTKGCFCPKVGCNCTAV